MTARWVTVRTAAETFGVSRDTVWRWLRDTHEAQVPRQKMRLSNERGHATRQLVVDLNALTVYESTLGELQKRTRHAANS